MIIKNALVTGGAGFIGSHIVQQLLEEGLNVTVVDDLSMGSRNNVPSDARFVEGNIRDLSLMRKLAGEADVVFHQAANAAWREWRCEGFEYRETGIEDASASRITNGVFSYHSDGTTSMSIPLRIVASCSGGNAPQKRTRASSPASSWSCCA